MIQTDNSTSTSTLPPLLNLSNLTTQTDIVKRLEELNKWQEEQTKLLEAKQTMQRQLLGMEQRTMYQALGLGLQDDDNHAEGKAMPQDHCQNDNDCEEYDEYTESCVQYEEVIANVAECAKDYEPSSYKTVTSGYATEEPLEVPNPKPKKPFLKRGQGLKQRFKIDPEELRITNLPKYKYANSHPNLKFKPPKPAALVKKKSNVRPQSPGKTTKALDAQEQRFQQLLISSKNVCNSTPDMKSSLASSKISSSASSNNSSTLPKVRFVESSLVTKKVQECPPAEGPPVVVATHGMAWSKILDPQQIHALPVMRKPPINSQPKRPSEDDIFELMEQKAKEGSFDMDSSYIKKFMQQRLAGENCNDTDVIPISEDLKTKGLQPSVNHNNPEEDTSSLLYEDDGISYATEENTELDEEQPQKSPHSPEASDTANNYKQAENRVRFSESNDTHEYHDMDTVTEASTMSMAGEADADHTNPEFFEQFKQALFAALQFKADQHTENDIQNSASDTTLTPKDSRLLLESQQTHLDSLELHEKTEMIKIRLQELEREIATFKENNIQLMKAKQEHELEKAVHAQEQLEATERLKDEKIQMEIYLHDERMKLEEEKRKHEQQIKMKTQAAAANKNKELEKLREQLAQMEVQLKNKENNHAAAQARWRTQMRAMEKEEKRLHEQIEALTKENKRLENEMLKINRENNNKLLQEINRNIAKLAPKQTTHADNFIATEGLPVLPVTRTLSKTIVATAAANRNPKPPAVRRTKRAQKALNNHEAKTRNPLPETPSSEETENTPENSYCEVKTTNKKENNFVEYDDDDYEEEEDILQELQAITPVRRNHASQIESAKTASDNKRKSPVSAHKAPPSSPTNMKREIVNNDGSKDIWYPNGNLKKISADGMLIRMLYYNKDIKETNINEGTVKYYYAETNTWHTTYLDGLEILEFPNGQVEHRHKDGVVEVHYPNNSVKVMDPRDEKKQEEWRFPDGTHLVQMRNGDKILSLPNGQKEIHTKLQKRREYPDGTVKIVYPDGSTETRYSNGRVRLKDKEGNLVMDTEVAG